MSKTKAERGYLHEEDRYMDFLHYSFGFNGVNDTFPAMLPKVYKNRDSILSSWIVRDEDGYIVSAVGAFENTINVCGTTLSAMGIGNVATHPRYRSKGYMKLCMQASLDEMIEKNTDLAFLGGRRHRYRNFGYEKCSSDLHFSVSQKIMSYFPNAQEPVLTMIEVKEDDQKVLDDIYAAHNARPYHVTREREKLFDIISSWHSTVLAFYKDDSLIGWAVAQKRDYISEIVILDDKFAGNMIYQIVRRQGTQKFIVPTFEKKTAAALQKYSENFYFGCDACFMILNYEKVLRAALELKASVQELPDCSFVVRINGIKQVENLEISVKDGKTSVNSTEKTPDFEFSHLDAQEFLLLNYTPLRDSLPASVSAVLPLPLFMPHVDNV